MYDLIIAIDGKTLRRRPAASAAAALRTWQGEEETGYDVACLDGAGATVTKLALRDEMRRSRVGAAAAPE